MRLDHLLSKEQHAHLGSPVGGSGGGWVLVLARTSVPWGPSSGWNIGYGLTWWGLLPLVRRAFGCVWNGCGGCLVCGCDTLLGPEGSGPDHPLVWGGRVAGCSGAGPWWFSYRRMVMAPLFCGGVVGVWVWWESCWGWPVCMLRTTQWTRASLWL